MNHPERAFSFAKIESNYDLVEAMFNHKWPICYGFHHGKLLYLSDGESEDLPEYAVLTIDKIEGRFGIHGREVGRIRPTRISVAEALEIVKEMNAGRYLSENQVQVRAEPMWHHSCRACRLEGD